MSTENKDGISKLGKAREIANPHPSIPKHLPAAARNNQRAQNTDHETSKGKQQHHSAPINIPDWSKIYRTSGAGDNYGGGGCTEEEGSEHDDEWVPLMDFQEASKLSRFFMFSV